MTMANVELLRAGIEWARAEAEKGDAGTWDQAWWLARSSSWTCGTKHCLAGNIAITAGWRPCWFPQSGAWDQDGTVIIVARDEATRVAHPETGATRDVEDLATELLEITEEEAEALFASENTLRDLYAISRDLTNGAIEVPRGPLPDGS